MMMVAVLQAREQIIFRLLLCLPLLAERHDAAIRPLQRRFKTDVDLTRGLLLPLLAEHAHMSGLKGLHHVHDITHEIR